jgi:hypothetical protein
MSDSGFFLGPRLSDRPLRRSCWTGNGDLLAAAEKVGFDLFLTVDQGIEYQQNLNARKVAIIIFQAKSNRLKDLVPLVPACLAHIKTIQPGHDRELSPALGEHSRGDVIPVVW